MRNNVWDEITYPFTNINGSNIEVREWISNFIPRFPGHMIIHDGIKVKSC